MKGQLQELQLNLALVAKQLKSISEELESLCSREEEKQSSPEHTQNGLRDTREMYYLKGYGDCVSFQVVPEKLLRDTSIEEEPILKRNSHGFLTFEDPWCSSPPLTAYEFPARDLKRTATILDNTPVR